MIGMGMPISHNKPPFNITTSCKEMGGVNHPTGQNGGARFRLKDDSPHG